jgi:WD40 repeat protein
MRSLLLVSPLLFLPLLLAPGALAQKPELSIQTGHSARISALAFSPDGNLLASGSDDHTIKLWDVATGTELRELRGHLAEVYTLAFAPSGRVLASGSFDTSIRFWDVATGEELLIIPAPGQVSLIAFSPDGKMVAGISSGKTQTLTLWDIGGSGVKSRTLDEHLMSGYGTIVFSGDGKRLASVRGDGTLNVWSIATGALLRTVEGYGKDGTAFAFTPDGETLASGGVDFKAIKIWGLGAGVRPRDLTGGHVAPSCMAFSGDGKILASGELVSNVVTLWDMTRGMELSTFAGTGWVDAVALSRDGGTLASAGNNTIFLWDTATGTKVRALAEDKENPVEAIAYSPDGKLLASGGFDKTIKLWDTVTDAPLRTLHGHTDPIHLLVFSPDGTRLASACEGALGMKTFDKTVRVWETATGRELFVLSGHAEAVKALAFSPDGEMLASGSEDNTVNLWRVIDGAKVRTLAGHTGGVGAVAFSPDGKMLASGGGDQTIRFWDAATGAELRTLRADAVESLAFSPDGRTLVSGSDREVRLWDVAAGTELSTLSGSRGLSGYRLRGMTPDGKVLAQGDLDHGELLGLFDARTGLELRTLTNCCGSPIYLAMSPDGKTLAGSYYSDFSLYDVSADPSFRKLTGRTTSVEALAFSPDGKTLVSGSDDDTIRLWSLGPGAGLSALHGHEGLVNAVAFSPDGRELLSGSFVDGTMKLWDVAKGTVLREFPGHSVLNLPEQKRGGPDTTVNINAVAFSPDGKTVACAGGVVTKSTWEVTLWDSDDGHKLRTLSGASDSILAIAFSPDGKILAGASEGKLIKLWDVATGKELHTLAGHAGAVLDLAFSPDGKTLASGSSDNMVKLWDVSAGTERRTLNGALLPVTSVAFSPDGKTLAGGSGDWAIRLWNTETGKKLVTLVGHTSAVTSVAFRPDGKTLASGSKDSTIKFWDATPTTEPSRQELVSLIAVDHDDWLAVTPEGSFDGPTPAWNQILWRFSPNLYDLAPVESFFGEFYYPELLSAVLSGQRPAPSKDISKKDRRPFRVALDAPDATHSKDTPLTSRRLDVKIEVAEAPVNPEAKLPAGGAQDVRLFRNGSLVKVWRGDVLQGKANATLDATIPIVAGENRLTAYAFNRDNVKSADARLVVWGADSLKRKGTAYVLAAGVNEYENREFNLHYAVPDAQDFADEVKRRSAALGLYERVEVSLLADGEATKKNFLDALSRLAAKAQPEDTVFVFFSGHGVAYRDRFYLIPHDLGYAGEREKLDEAGFRVLISHGVSDVDLSGAFEGLDAGQIMLVIDACNSGQALGAEGQRLGPMNSKGLAQLAYEKGMYILTAAQSFQSANENSQLGHGFLTFALVEEGLKKTAADSEPKDGEVTIREWLRYTTWRVPQIYEEQMEGGDDIRKLHLGSQGNKGLRLVTDEVQRPRVFYRREVDGQSLVVTKAEGSAKPAGTTP